MLLEKRYRLSVWIWGTESIRGGDGLHDNKRMGSAVTAAAANGLLLLGVGVGPAVPAPGRRRRTCFGEQVRAG